ncbi:MAG TPA: response regulator transcription factor [Cyclobacteriaceae bacterium]|jgi:DNA-binding response OmpR family regulator|nr:response regulator transcription factor [Cyclobacteriaceae bacterium]
MQIKILYVEDEPFLGRIVKESLETRGFEVRLVADGALAHTVFDEIQPDISVLDVMLPNKDGFAIARELRKRRADIPIIFVTAKTQTEDLLKGFESGGNDYLRKPFSMEELIARINNLLQLTQKNAKVKGVESFGKYQFDPSKYELRIDQNVRKISHREAMLLQTLLENKNSAVNRKDVLLKVWGDDSFFNSRNLDVYITKLRDYLKDDPSVKIITLKGIGYHFSVG